jgi:hypothetical protein
VWKKKWFVFKLFCKKQRKKIKKIHTNTPTKFYLNRQENSFNIKWKQKKTSACLLFKKNHPKQSFMWTGKKIIFASNKKKGKKWFFYLKTWERVSLMATFLVFLWQTTLRENSVCKFFLFFFLSFFSWFY